MVVPVKKDEWLFVDDNEECVDELTGYIVWFESIVDCRVEKNSNKAERNFPEKMERQKRIHKMAVAWIISDCTCRWIIPLNFYRPELTEIY